VSESVPSKFKSDSAHMVGSEVKISAPMQRSHRVQRSLEKQATGKLSVPSKSVGFPLLNAGDLLNERGPSRRLANCENALPR
jgi:hypothetical protein